jgi:hypothetical protein
MKTWMIIVIIVIIAILFFMFMTIPIPDDSQCRLKCAESGYSSSFCENVGTYGGAIEEVETRENATRIQADCLLNQWSWSYIGAYPMCFCKNLD